METFKKIGKALWSKQLVAGAVGAILGAIGVALRPEVVDSLVCLLGVSGCD